MYVYGINCDQLKLQKEIENFRGVSLMIKGSVPLSCKKLFSFSRKRFQKTEFSFHFQFFMKILENAFG